MQKRILQSLCIEPQYKGTLGMGIKYLTKSKQGNKSNALFCIFQAWHRVSNANNMAIWTDIRAFLTLFLTWSLIQSFNKQVALDWKRWLINRADWFCIVLSSSKIQVWKKILCFCRSYQIQHFCRNWSVSAPVWEGRAKSAAGRTQSEPVQKNSALETLTNEIALSAYLSRQYGNENVKPLFTEPANRQASGSFGPLSAQGQNGENHDHWSAQRAAARGGWRSILYISHIGSPLNFDF